MTGMTNGGYLILAVVQAALGCVPNSRWWVSMGFLYPSVGACGCCWWLVPTRVYLQIENMKLYMEMSIGEVFLDMPYRASRLTLYESIEI